MITPLPRLPPPSLSFLTFAGRVTPLEAADQRNCLLSRVDFSCACKLLCIDTLSEQGRHTGQIHSPPHSHSTQLGVPQLVSGVTWRLLDEVFSLGQKRDPRVEILILTVTLYLCTWHQCPLSGRNYLKKQLFSIIRCYQTPFPVPLASSKEMW